MGKGDEELFKMLLNFSKPPEEKPANSLFGLIGGNQPANNGAAPLRQF